MLVPVGGMLYSHAKVSGMRNSTYVKTKWALWCDLNKSKIQSAMRSPSDWEHAFFFASVGKKLDLWILIQSLVLPSLETPAQ